MKLSRQTITKLAEMVCGHVEIKSVRLFPYRKSSELTEFFLNCDVDERHDGSTRQHWVFGVLEGLNAEIASNPNLPADSLLKVIAELMDIDHFDKYEEFDHAAAMVALNDALRRDSLVAFLGDLGKCHIRHDGTGVTSANLPRRPRPLTHDEKAQRERLSVYLDESSEDQFTQDVIVPLFQRLGFHRIEVLGHKEKTLEYGKDFWMKYQLPTGHWLYFGGQVKKLKIDSKGTSGGNVTEVLNQVRMALGHSIFDPDLNRTVLPDHMFVISAAEITRAARQWLVGHLDKEQRRQLIFMDRSEFLEFAAQIVPDIHFGNFHEVDVDDIPF